MQVELWVVRTVSKVHFGEAFRAGNISFFQIEFVVSGMVNIGDSAGGEAAGLSVVTAIFVAGVVHRQRRGQ